MTDAQMLAIAFLVGGGGVVAVGIGALLTYLHARFDLLRRLDQDASNERAALTGELLQRLERVGDATDLAVAILKAHERRAGRNEHAASLRAVADRHARIVRLQAARRRQPGRRSPRSGR